MLQKLNERLQGVVAWVIIVLVATTFTLFGVDYYIQARQTSTNVAIEVNGNPISKEVVNLKYERMRQALEARGVTVLDKQYKAQVLNELVLNQVSTQAAAQYGFNVSNSQALQSILQIPAFQEKGQFSQSRYLQILGGMQYTHDTFQREVQESMLLNQQRFAFIDTAFALPNEVDAYVKLYNQVRDYRYMMISSRIFLNTVTVSTDDVQRYFNQHTQDYISPETVSLEFVRLSMSDIKAKIHLTSNELNQYYQENQSSYVTKKGKVKPLKEVQASISEQLLAERAQADYARALEELSDLSYQTPDELTSVSEKLGLTLERTPLFSKQGGDSDVSKNPQIIQAAFSRDLLSLGNNSSPIQLDNETMVVVRVAQHIPPKERPLHAVKSLIEESVRKEKAREEAIKLGEAILHAKDKQTREQLIAQHHLTWAVASQVSREQKEVPEWVNAIAFSLPSTPDNLIGRNLTDSKGYVVVEIQKVVDGDLKSVDKEKLAGIIKQIETRDGMLDYDLYIKQLMNQAKIVRN
jgi:peptidyl-prolyl cis-trans isomerase D